MSTSPDAVRAVYTQPRLGPIATLRDTVDEVLSRRRLIMYLVRADLKKHGSDTLLGNIWWILDPLLSMLVYVVLISVILQSKIDAYPLFIFCAILPWKWFSSTIAGSTTSVIGREKIIKQVHFPKIVLPLSTSVGGIANFMFGLIPLAAMMVLFFPTHLTPWILLIPVVAAVQFLFTVGLSILLSSLTVFYRDIGLLTTHLLRLWFYLSPALYGTEQIQKLAENHKELAMIYDLNPFAGLFESYRYLIYYGQPPTWNLLAIVVVESIVLLLAAVLIFRRLEPSFAKVL
ncbi:MAG TPA: ABC transporter permease [Candidatus Limnocylindrales bacterium]